MNAPVPSPEPPSPEPPNRQPPQRLWTPNFVLVLATNLTIALVFYLLMTTMALYASERFGAGESIAGFAASAFIVGAILSRALGGKLLDVIGRRRTLLTSLVVFVAAALLYIPADSLGLLIALRLVHGVAFGAGNTALAASVMGLIPPARRSEGTGYFGISATLATAVGPLIAVTLADRVGYGALFGFCAACSLVGLVVAIFLRLPERTPTAQEIANRWRLSVSDVFDPSSLPIATIMLIAGAAYSGILTSINSYARANDFFGAASAFFMVYAVCVLVCRLFVGRIQDRRGDNIVVYPTIVLFALGLAMLAAAPSGGVIALAGALVGFGFGALMPCAQAIAVTQAPEARVAYATATFFLMLDIGTGLGPILLGLIVAGAGFEAMYAISAVVMLATTLLYYAVHGRSQVRPGPV